MLHPDEDTNAQYALQKLSNCTKCIQKFQTAIRSLLDDIHNAESSGEIDKKVELWVHGQYAIDIFIEKLDAHIRDADDFLGSNEFDMLSPTKKGDYFDAITRISRDYEKLQTQYAYYALLGDIECSERTIIDFSKMLKRSYRYITYRKGISALRNRGLSMHKKRVKNIEDYIKTETKKLLKIIERAITHPLFQEMSQEKRNSYNEKWKYYQDELGKIDSV